MIPGCIDVGRALSVPSARHAVRPMPRRRSTRGIRADAWKVSCRRISRQMRPPISSTSCRQMEQAGRAAEAAILVDESAWLKAKKPAELFAHADALMAHPTLRNRTSDARPGGQTDDIAAD